MKKGEAAMLRLEKKATKLREQKKPAYQNAPGVAEIELLLEIAEAEPVLITGQLACQSVGHCIMGAIYRSLGASDKAMKRYGTGYIFAVAGNTFGYVPLKIARRLYDTFRLDEDDVRALIHVNDDEALTDVITLDADDDEDRDYTVIKNREAIFDRIVAFFNDGRARKRP
jgi:hypothetical protein